MKVQAVIQARMTSTRLPGKVLKTVCGKSLLQHHIDRLRKSAELSRIVVATTVNATDEPIVSLCEQLDVEVFRGSEENVLSRYYGAARSHPEGAVARLTSDCPLIDPEVVDGVIRGFLQGRGALDYVSNTIERTFPRGLDVEVFSFEALERAQKEAKDPYELEHVTPYFYRNPALFRIESFTRAPRADQYRLTVDTPDDFRLITRIFEELYPANPNFGLSDILDCLTRHPDWAEINRHVVQKA